MFGFEFTLGIALLLGMVVGVVGSGLVVGKVRLPAAVWWFGPAIVLCIGATGAVAALTDASALMARGAIHDVSVVATEGLTEAHDRRWMGLAGAAGLLLLGAWGSSVGVLARATRWRSGSASMAVVVCAVGLLGSFVIAAVTDLSAPVLGMLAYTAVLLAAVAAAFLRDAGVHHGEERALAAGGRLGAVASALGGVFCAGMAVSRAGPGLEGSGGALWVVLPTLAALAVLGAMGAVPNLRRLMSARVGFSATAAAMVVALALFPQVAIEVAKGPLVEASRGGMAARPGLGIADVAQPVNIVGNVVGGHLAGHCLVQQVGSGWAASPMYSPRVGLGTRSGCPGPDTLVSRPFSDEVVPLIAAPASMKATKLLARPWFSGRGVVRLLLRDPDPEAEQGAYLSSVAVAVVPPHQASPGLWVAERGGRAALFVRARYAGDLEHRHASSRFRVALARSGASSVRFIVNDHWTVQDLVTRCLTVQGFAEVDGGVACEVVGAGAAPLASDRRRGALLR